MIFLKGKSHDLGDKFFITRYLPDIQRRSVGPFLFFDFFGPVDFPPGKGVDVRPHPHIGLATVTYLFEGTQMHRDTLGSVQEIKPGDVNWMTAGRGIAHSERTGTDMRAHGHRLHGIQTWVGLPGSDEEAEPHFQHFGAAELPVVARGDVELRLMVGSAFGLTSPVKTFSPIFYADARFAVGGVLTYDAEHEERGLLIIDGDIQIGSDILPPGTMIVLDKGEEITMFAQGSARAVLFGGLALDGVRHLWWNFVSSSKDRIEQAKQDWKAGKFGLIPGDDKEFIPLPEEEAGGGSPMKSTIVFVVGVFVLAEGILFALQGSGLVAWPRQSFMINDHDWIERGIVVALIGVALILTAWRIQKKP